MQSSRLFRRNNQKILGIFPQRLWPSRSFSLSSVKRRSADESGCCESSCCDPGESSDDNIKVTVIGAAGRVGRTLSLLLKTSPLVDQLCMFDVDKSVKGICMDISHIDTKCCVSHVTGMCNIQEALEDPDVVLIAAGCPMTPEIDSKQLFRKNAPIVAGLSEAFARFCPEACLVLITSPINSLLPVAGEVYELVTGEKPTSRLFGLTTLDVVRANTFTAEAVRRDPSNVIVPVIGGTSQDTIVPVISQMKPCCRIKHEEVIALTECVKQAEESLTDCQNCGTRGASSLSTAYAAFRFTSSLISALKGEQDIIECAYVQSNILPELEYMASPIKLGVCGMEYNYGYPRLSDRRRTEHDRWLERQLFYSMGSAVSFARGNVVESRRYYSRRTHRREISPLYPTRHPNVEVPIKCELNDGTPQKVDIEETKRRMKKYCAEIDELNKADSAMVRENIAEQSCELQTEESMQRVRRKAGRTRDRYRDREEREERLIRHIERREMLLEEMNELKKKNQQLELLVLAHLKRLEQPPPTGLRKLFQTTSSLLLEKWNILKKMILRNEPQQICKGGRGQCTGVYINRTVQSLDAKAGDCTEEDGEELTTDVKLPFLANLLRKFEAGRKDNGEQ